MSRNKRRKNYARSIDPRLLEAIESIVDLDERAAAAIRADLVGDREWSRRILQTCLAAPDVFLRELIAVRLEQKVYPRRGRHYPRKRARPPIHGPSLFAPDEIHPRPSLPMSSAMVGDPVEVSSGKAVIEKIAQSNLSSLDLLPAFASVSTEEFVAFIALVESVDPIAKQKLIDAYRTLPTQLPLPPKVSLFDAFDIHIARVPSEEPLFPEVVERRKRKRQRPNKPAVSLFEKFKAEGTE